MKTLTDQGIVLNRFNYSESSIIVNILTKEHGKMGFIINGARKKKTKMHSGYFQAFNIIEFEFIPSTRSDLHRIKEVSPNTEIQNLFFDIHKSAICMLLSELVNKLYPYLEQNSNLFQFLEHLILYIDTVDIRELKNINLWAIVRIMQFAGIQPENNYSESKPLFNPIEGHFTDNKYANASVFSEKESRLLHLILKSSIEDNHEISISRNDKRNLIDQLLNFIQIQFEGFKTGKALDIIMETFD